MKTLLFLARRFLWNVQEKSIALMTVICFSSIVIGACALALVAAIMNGIERETRAIVQGIHPDLIIQGGGNALNYSKIQEFVTKNYADSVAAMSPSMQGHAMIKAGKGQGISALVMLMAIDPATEQSVSKLGKLITQPAQPVSTLLGQDRVLIGNSLAHSLAAKTGDAITLVFAPELEENDEGKSMLEQRRVTIGGIFKTGIEDIDANVIFSDLALGAALFPDKGITQIGIKLRRPHQEKEVLSSLKQTLGLTIFSWKDLYPALLSALTLEKYATILILALIALVASINIISLLFMYIAYKKTEIAVLRTLGFTQRDIIKLFIAMGTAIGLFGALTGVALASLISFLLNRYQLIRLPEVYYVSHLPAHMNSTIALSIIALVVIISFLASLLPARSIGKIDPSALLKKVA